MILVTGATGHVGTALLDALAGADVRAMSRSPGPGLVPGDLRKPETLPLDGVDRAFLLWPGPDSTGMQEAVDALAAGGVRHVVYLSAISAETGFWGVAEEALRTSGMGWTFLRAGGFATNTLGWAEMIKATGAVRWPYGQAARSLIHERDIADVAALALTQGGHEGCTYELTGPAVITQAEQVRQIGLAAGRPVRWVELEPAAAREQLLAEWGDPGFVDGALAYWASLVERPEAVTRTVEELTGRAGRTFGRWAAEHAGDFR